MDAVLNRKTTALVIYSNAENNLCFCVPDKVILWANKDFCLSEAKVALPDIVIAQQNSLERRLGQQ